MADFVSFLGDNRCSFLIDPSEVSSVYSTGDSYYRKTVIHMKDGKEFIVGDNSYPQDVYKRLKGEKHGHG